MKPFPHVYDKFFQNTFHTSLRQYFHPIFGFDIIKFDDWLISRHGYDCEASGKSASEFVTEKFGEAATKMIHALIKL